MGCVSGKNNEQNTKKQEELKPYIHQQSNQHSQPVESNSYPNQTSQHAHQSSNHFQPLQNIEKQGVVQSSIQNPPKNHVPSVIQATGPQVLPTSSNVKRDPHSGIKQDDIKIGGVEGNGVLNSDHEAPVNAIQEDLIVSNGDKKEQILIAQNVKEHWVQAQQSDKKKVEYFMKQIKQEQQQAVRSEGGVSFIPIVKGINFQIHIN